MQRLPLPIRLIVVALIDWWDGWLIVAIINAICGLCWLTIVLGPPATFGMYYAMNELTHGRGTGFRDLIDGGRRYFLKSWLWMALNLVIVAVVFVSLRFYGAIQGDLGLILQGVVVVLTILWLVVQFYALPYFMEQQEKRLIMALRNGLFTALASPLYTLIVFGFAAIVMAISVALIALLFLGGPAYVAILGSRAVLDRIDTFGVRQRDAERHQDAKPDNKSGQ